MAENTFTINSLASATPALTDYFIKSDDNANYRKCTLNDIATAIAQNTFATSEYDVSEYITSDFTSSRAIFKRFGQRIHFLSIQVTSVATFDAPYGKNVITDIPTNIAIHPSCTSELVGYNVTQKCSIRAYRVASGAIAVSGSANANDVIIIGGMYIA